MSLWRQVSRGLRALFNRKAADQEIADEIAHFLDESAATFAARGLAREEALRAAAWNWAAPRRCTNRYAGTDGRTRWILSSATCAMPSEGWPGIGASRRSAS